MSAVFVTCQSCFAKNRIPADKLSAAPKCGKCKEEVLRPQPIELDDSNFYRFVQNNNMPIVVDFWASWCGPCQQMAPMFDAMSANLFENFRFVKVNTEVAQQVSAQHGIRSIPTLALYKDGQLINQQAGAMNQAQLQQWLIEQLNIEV